MAKISKILNSSRRRMLHGKLAILLIFFAICVISHPAKADTSIYVFDPNQSTVVRSGGITGLQKIFSVAGQFRLFVDLDAAIASFEKVDAGLTDETGSVYGQSLNEVFNMTGLAGTIIDGTTIQFEGKTADGTESDVSLKLTLGDNSAHLTGSTTPPPNSADMFFYEIDGVATKKYSGGTGEPNDPYQIATAEDLMLLGETPEDYDKHFILTTDIDLDPNLPGGRVFDRAVIACGTHTWDWPYFQGTPFTGMLDGNGHTISHLTITGGGYLGLIGQLGQWPPGGQIRNIGVVDVNISTRSTRGGPVGGVVGYNYFGSVTQCHSTGTVSSDWTVGGLVGYNEEGTVTQCYSASEVTGTGTCVGGLVGQSGWYDRVNGISWGGDINDCYSTGAATGAMGVGGLVGLTMGGRVVNCFSSGGVRGNSGAGGLVGARTNLQGEEITVIDSFWDTQTSGQATSAGGKGKTTAEMQRASTFIEAGWDFVGETQNGPNDVWKIVEGQTYPLLSWQKYSGGTGEPNDPYQIATAEDLMLLGETPEDYDKHFILTADIDLDPNLPGRKVFDRAVIGSGIDADFRLIGTPFSGVFDGNGHTISHMMITDEDVVGSVGLFALLSYGAQVKNLGITDVNVLTSGSTVGALTGLCYDAVVTQCHSSGIVSGTYDVGGLVGKSQGGTVSQCRTGGKVSGNEYVGGLVGSNGGAVTDCYNTSVVDGNVGVGGLVGVNHSARRSDQYFGTVANCYNTGAVNGKDWVGGLAGCNPYGDVTQSYSAGAVHGESHVGGLVGDNRCGYDWGSVGTVTYSFWDTQTSGQAVSAGGTGKTTAEMQTASTFLDAGWDFVDEVANGTEDIWSICEGTNYPRLVWQIPAGDFVCPYGITIDDFLFFMEHWLDDNCDLSNDYCEGTDLDQSGTVDVSDLEIFFENWLAEK
jgi:hypothetical protein